MWGHMENIITSLTWVRKTKGTHFYEEDDIFDTPSIRSIYLVKSFAEEGGKYPEKVGVIVAEMEVGESLDDFVARIIEGLR